MIAMNRTSYQTFDIQTVQAIQPTKGALGVVFANGLAATIVGDDPQRDRLLREAERSKQQQRPVGVLVDADGRLRELSPTHEVSVRSIREEPDEPTRLAIWFWSYSPVCYLTRDHPEFDRIRAILEHAAATGGRVWLANRLDLVDSATERWWQILDVRPADAAAAGDRNGTR
jgi:hypothetical protein